MISALGIDLGRITGKPEVNSRRADLRHYFRVADLGVISASRKPERRVAPIAPGEAEYISISVLAAGAAYAQFSKAYGSLFFSIVAANCAA